MNFNKTIEDNKFMRYSKIAKIQMIKTNYNIEIINYMITNCIEIIMTKFNKDIYIEFLDLLNHFKESNTNIILEDILTESKKTSTEINEKLKNLNICLIIYIIKSMEGLKV